MSISFRDTSSSILFHKLTLQPNVDDNNDDASSNIVNGSAECNILKSSNNHSNLSSIKSLPPLPLLNQKNTPNSKRVYQSLSTTTSSSSIDSKSIIHSSSIILDSRSSSSSDSSIISSKTTSGGNINNGNTSISIKLNDDIESKSFSYDDDDSDGSTLFSSSRKSNNDNDEKNYDLSYYFHADEHPTTTVNSSTQQSKTAEKEADTSSREEIEAKSTFHRARSLSIGSTVSSHFISNASVVTAAAFREYDNPSFGGFAKDSETEEVKQSNNDHNNAITTTPSSTCKIQQQLFKFKTDRSNKKAFKFFGEQIKLEVSAKEIKKEGLKALLYSTVPLGYFLYHLLNEYSSENLFFFLAVENYQNYNFSNDLERLQVAHKISRSYLTKNSELEVNLEDQISRKVRKALVEQEKRPSTSTGNEFDLAKKHVFSLLNVSYYRFRTSSIWDIMESKCGNLNSYNRERAQALVVNLLLSYLKRNNSSSLSKLVHSFCKIYLPIGYESKLSSSSYVSTKENNCNNSINRRNRSKSVGGSEKKGSNFISNKIDTIFFKANKINR